MLSERRDEAAATAFFIKAIGSNGWPDKVVIDKCGSNTAGLFNMNCLLVMCGWSWLITVRRTKYLNNIIEQDHRFIKKLTTPMQTFKSLNSASATLAGIEVAHMIRKGQSEQSAKRAFDGKRSQSSMMVLQSIKVSMASPVCMISIQLPSLRAA
jgi:putative transposase